MTPLDDGTLLVYRAVEGNPAGLAPGDVVRGFDGVPWPELLEQIRSWELPTCGGHGTTDEAEESLKLESALLNLHLFSELDIERYGTGELVSIPTDELLGQEYSLACTDQMPVYGVDLPWLFFDEQVDSGEGDVSYGVLPDTNVGYIYVYSWHEAVADEFTEAVEALMGTGGLIVDSRYNLGGPFMGSAEVGLSLLFGEDLEEVLTFATNDPDSEDPHDMELGDSYTLPSSFEPDSDSSYDRPIAVLTGPKSISMGDIVPYVLKHHPRARRFGRPTNGAFGSMTELWPDADPYIGDLDVSFTPAIFAAADGTWLHRSVQMPEEAVWLTRDDVAAGRDTVVEAALAWIAEE